MSPELRRIPLPSDEAGRDATLVGEWAYYLARVLRCRPGDGVLAFCGDGYDYRYEVSVLSGDRLDLKFMERRKVDTDPTRELALLVALPKAGKLEAIIEAATALGATRVLPFVAVRSEGKPAGERRARWEKAALAAARQCGRTTRPLLSPTAVSLAEACRALRAALPDVRAALGEPGAPLTLAAWARDLPPDAPRAWLVGPEGDLTAGERDLARAAGLSGVALGPRILRAELAVAAGLALLSA